MIFQVIFKTLEILGINPQSSKIMNINVEPTYTVLLRAIKNNNYEEPKAEFLGVRPAIQQATPYEKQQIFGNLEKSRELTEAAQQNLQQAKWRLANATTEDLPQAELACRDAQFIKLMVKDEVDTYRQ